MFKYKNSFIELASPVSIENCLIRNKVFAVNFQEIKKMLSCLVDYLIIDIVYINNEGYLIVKNKREIKK
jgi:hypothetical protein